MISGTAVFHNQVLLGRDETGRGPNCRESVKQARVRMIKYEVVMLVRVKFLIQR